MKLNEQILRIQEMMGVLFEEELKINNTLKKGDKGDEVKKLQKILGIYDDGIFGSQTRQCVKDFQNKSQIIDDGIVGPITKKYLQKLINKEINWDSPNYCKTKENWGKYKNKITDVQSVDKNEVNFVDIDDSDLSKFNFHKIPVGQNNYRSAQITGDILPSVIKKYNIKNIIRMNGDGNDSRHKSSFPSLSRKQEEEICNQNGCNFYFINAHSGYDQTGGGYNKSINQIIPILDKGNTLIHCAHGADRTGGMVGAYLKNKGWGNGRQIWDYTTKYNGWRNMSPDTFYSGYNKYAEGFISKNEIEKLKPR